MRIALVACCGAKLRHAAPAADLYISPLFRKAAAFAGTLDAWYILSAKYGLVHPQEVIKPYDCTLLRMAKSDRLAWGQTVKHQMREASIADAEFVALAGAKYVEPLLQAGLALETPMKGLGIGQQLAWLTKKAPREKKGAFSIPII
jgi:hypothetical protein